MLKGKTIIELTDVKTGEIERHEDNNMVTNALDEFFNSVYGFIQSGSQLENTNYTFNSRFFTPMFKKLLGGILLFTSRIDENPNTFYAPPDVECHGYASTEAYGGGNSFRGSWNDSESGELEDGTGLKFVWDFSTSQANGVIACAALTTPFGGRFGYGMDINSTKIEYAYPICNNNQSSQSDASSNWFKIGTFLKSNVELTKPLVEDNYNAINDGIAWVIDTTDGGTFSIKKYDANPNRVSITKAPQEMYLMNETEITTSIFTDNAVSIAGSTSSFTRYLKAWIQCDFDFDGADNENGYLYLYSPYQNGSTSVRYQTISVIKINLDDYSIVFEKTFTTRDAVMIPLNNGHQIYNYFHWGCIQNDYLYTTHYDGTYNSITGTFYQIIKINLNDPTDIKKIDLTFPEDQTNKPSIYFKNQQSSMNCLGKIKGRILTPCHIIDKNDNVLLYPVWYNSDLTPSQLSDGNWFYNSALVVNRTSNYSKLFFQINQPNLRDYVIAYQKYLGFYTPVLFTINNLSEPVLKTADKTMKITYILREGATG